jgi:hypothetical protein
MSAFLLLTAVRTQVAATGIVRRIADRIADERGQDTIEYLGVLLVVAALIGLVMGVVPSFRQTIINGANSVIDSVFNAKANNG